MNTFNVTSLSVTELEELEKTLSTQHIKVRHGIMDETFKGHNHNEAENIISEKLNLVKNQITAKKIRG